MHLFVDETVVHTVGEQAVWNIIPTTQCKCDLGSCVHCEWEVCVHQEAWNVAGTVIGSV